MVDLNKNKSANFFHYNDFDANKSVTSWFISPKSLLIIRGIICLYSWIILVGQFTDNAVMGKAGEFFKYFTNMSFVGLVAYFTTAFYHSYQYVIKRTTSFQNQNKMLNWLFWILYHTIVQFSMLIVLTYWLFLSGYFIYKNPRPFDWWLNISVHGMNFLFVIIELFLNRQVMVVSFVIISTIIQALYTIVVLINYAVTKYWLYGFFDVTKGLKSAIWYIGLYIAYSIIYFIMFGVHLLRDYLGNRFGRYKDKDFIFPV